MPDFKLSDDGRALMISRFDLTPDRHYCGFEHFCALNELGTDQKYEGFYETRRVRRIKDLAVTNTDGGRAMLKQALKSWY